MSRIALRGHGASSITYPVTHPVDSVTYPCNSVTHRVTLPMRDTIPPQRGWMSHIRRPRTPLPPVCLIYGARGGESVALITRSTPSSLTGCASSVNPCDVTSLGVLVPECDRARARPRSGLLSALTKSGGQLVRGGSRRSAWLSGPSGPFAFARKSPRAAWVTNWTCEIVKSK